MTDRLINHSQGEAIVNALNSIAAGTTKPTVTVVKTGNKATITATDHNGTTTAEIFDGMGYAISVTAIDCPGETLTVTDGESTYTDELDSSGKGTVLVAYPGVYTASINGRTIGSVQVGSFSLESDAKVYGFHVDGTKSDPAQMISYDVSYGGEPVANANYTPAAVNLSTGVMNPGSWNLTDDFFVPRSCMLKYNGEVDYYLDENDETKKADGTASDVANTDYGGNAMMEWGRDGRKIWTKIVPDDTPTDGATVYVANYQADFGFRCLSFYDCDGNPIDHFYTPKYNGSTVSGKLRSLSGRTPTNTQTGATEVTYANANNVNGKVEWDTETWCDRTLIDILLLMIGKNTNTQAVFGQGYTTGGSAASSLANTGTLNGKGQWFGSSTNNSKTAGVKVFGMEHWWGNIWRRVRGLLNMSGTVKYKLTYSQVDGTTQDGYDATGSGYKTVTNGTPGGTSGGYANVAVFNEDGIFTKTASGSETTYYCDGLWFNNSQANYAFVGGDCYYAALCGALCVSLANAFSYAYWTVGAALSCKPLASSG